MVSGWIKHCFEVIGSKITNKMQNFWKSICTISAKQKFQTWENEVVK